MISAACDIFTNITHQPGDAELMLPRERVLRTADGRDTCPQLHIIRNVVDSK